MRAKSRSEHKLEIREQAKQKVRGEAYDISSRAKYQSDVQHGYNQLKQLGKEAGDSKAKQVRAELTYLLNNYIPQNDTRIEQLIDMWRRSGDPLYDPGIRAKLMRCRRDDMKQGTAL
ncbi:MAG: hypothetical protein HZB26_12055 [Candidatus Hydrogenedentes bacterium]|nr:hypothetical protein [Candidatus Hydrogenedentota bacterium]